ncbi:MAG: SusD/RagB family nutrient-binding outer membrane lipoprotein [Prevotellaceae bacterium]|jgi:hypothetical protein|nr:SusD/RagB family nutrient-binding outer membrane lipoprotein [Prevotellaceae bacterium]
MKKIYILFAFLALFTAWSCTDMEEINTDPDNPLEIPSNMVFSGAQKRIMDFVYDNWFGGRQCLLYSQYWAQINYTEEDRYQIRESVNNNYFNDFYRCLAALDRVIELNTNPETAWISSGFGANQNQIAASRILKCWLYLLMTDTWGDIPYSEAGKLAQGVYYPKYDDQKTLYDALISELKAAAAQIDEDEPAFIGGDRIYDGDAAKWKKFANSLQCRIAVHTSKVDANWKKIITDAIANGVFESNDDAAAYHYSTVAPEYCHFYEGTYIEARNDFTMTRPFMDILKGQRDTLNNKQHPWDGVTDPRLYIFTTPGEENTYIGQPYGASSDIASNYSDKAPDWGSNPPVHLQADYPVPLMTYAELQFIISEYKGFSEEEYRNGIAASLDYWASVSKTAIESDDANNYIDTVIALGGVNAETVALQKYIDLYTNGTEAWTEIRRTGYPKQLISPNEIIIASSERLDAEQPDDPADVADDVKFDPLSEVKGLIIARVKYPTLESTVNGKSWDAAVSRLKDGTNNYYSQMFWDKRSTTVPHPANK